LNIGEASFGFASSLFHEYPNRFSEVVLDNKGNSTIKDKLIIKTIGKLDTFPIFHVLKYHKISKNWAQYKLWLSQMLPFLSAQFSCKQTRRELQQ
jgi:hypothetical protein